MNKFVLASMVLAFSASSMAEVNLSKESFHVLWKGSSLGSIDSVINQNKSSIIINTKGSGFVTLPNGARQSYKASAEHIFDNSWGWKSSTIRMPFTTVDALISVSDKAVKITTNYRNRKVVSSSVYNGLVLPRRSFYSYLRSAAKPKPLEKQNAFLFNEANFKVYEVTWAYLGMQKIAGKNLHKYEIYGLNTVITIDEKSNIRSVKELDAGLELVN